MDTFPIYYNKEELHDYLETHAQSIKCEDTFAFQQETNAVIIPANDEYTDDFIDDNEDWTDWGETGECYGDNDNDDDDGKNNNKENIKEIKNGLPIGINKMSEEQEKAIMHVVDGDNLILDSVSGSGKSTCVLNLSHLLPHKRILQLTYNADLRQDVKHKIIRAKLFNIKVHTFHSLAVKYYNRSAITDSGIRNIIYNDITPIEELPKFDIIVLDESQDMTFLYYQFMVKMTRDMGTRFNLFILGDYKQCLYQFKGADERFLTLAEKIWQMHPNIINANSFYYCKLKTSYRITNQMSRFLNETMLGENRMVAVKDGEKVVYIRHSRSNTEKMIINYIRRFLAMGYSPNDIFVLAPSVKSAGSNIRKMENYLVENGIPTHVPMFETEKIDKRVMEGKIVFSTFHSSKGRERKIVIVSGFDQSYFDYYGTNLNDKECPNTFYVATTRAQEHLIVIENNQHATDRPLDFLKQTHHQMKQQPYIEFKGMPQSIFYAKTQAETENKAIKDRMHDITPTSLIQFIPENILELISPIIDRIFVRESDEPKKEDEIPIPTMIKTKDGLYEDVSDLNGIAIPSIYYDYIHTVFMDERNIPNIGANILYNIIHACLDETKDHEFIYLKQIVYNLKRECTTPRDYLYLANVYVSAKEKLYYKLKQIGDGDYIWLTDAIINRCIARLNAVIGKECRESNTPPMIEIPIVQYSMADEIAKINEVLKPYFIGENKIFRFSARTDLITERTIWEIKCTSSITIEHKLQVIIYDWIWRIISGTTEIQDKKAKILNLKSGEIVRLDASFEELTGIVVKLLKGKYDEPEIKDNDIFIKECVEYMNGIFSTQKK